MVRVYTNHEVGVSDRRCEASIIFANPWFVYTRTKVVGVSDRRCEALIIFANPWFVYTRTKVVGFPNKLFTSLQRLLNIRNNIAHMFQAYGNANEAGCNAYCGSFRFRQFRMCG